MNLVGLLMSDGQKYVFLPRKREMPAIGREDEKIISCLKKSFTSLNYPGVDYGQAGIF